MIFAETTQMSQKMYLFLIVVVCSIVLTVGLSGFAPPAVAQLGNDFTEAVPHLAPSSNLVIVKLSEPPVASNPNAQPAAGAQLVCKSPEAQAAGQQVDRQQNDFINYLKSAAPAAQVLRQFKIVFNGLAVALNGTDQSVILAGPHVKSLSFSRTFLPTMNTSHTVIGTSTLWNQVGGTTNAGAGIKVGIIDSGIDQTHPFLTDASLLMPDDFPICDIDANCKLTSPKVIVARAYPQNGTTSALAVNPHGTHVSGTVAGVSGTVAPVATTALSGVAPKAYLGNYNVFPGSTKGAQEPDIIAALDDAVCDGMNVVNMSLGGPVQLPGSDPLEDAVNSTVDAGLVAAVAAGNSGPGSETIDSPGTAEKAIIAGATTNPHFIGIPVTTGSSKIGAAVGEFNPYTLAKTSAYASWDPALPTSGEACENTKPLAVQGKIALIRRGSCTFTTKVRNAENAGAIGVLIFNNMAGDPVGMADDGTTPKPTIPAVMVSKKNGEAMHAANGGPVTVDGSQRSEFVTDSVDIIAGFSSRGSTPFTARIKPDVSAPGVNIYSSVPGNGYALFQGTSMATPHVAGAAALLRQLHPRWTPQQVKSALSSSAKRLVFDHKSGMDAVTVMNRGTGRIDLTRAGSVVATFNPSNISYGKKIIAVPFAESRTIAVKNTTNVKQTYTVAVSEFSGDPHLKIPVSPKTLALDPGKEGTVVLTMTADSLVAIGAALGTGEFEGDIVVTSPADTRGLYVPYWVSFNNP